MPTTTEELRQALEDLVYANIKDIFLMKSGEETVASGNNAVTFSGDAYDSSDDYEVRIIEAIDSEGTDIKGEIEITGRTVNGFTINWQPFATGITAGTVKWITARVTPKINMHTS